jgi:hypothetical protein
MMVLLAVSLPRLTKYESSKYNIDLQGNLFVSISYVELEIKNYL